MSSETLLEVRNVTQMYGSGERRFTAIEKINLTLREGEFVTLVGPIRMWQKHALEDHHRFEQTRIRCGVVSR